MAKKPAVVEEFKERWWKVTTGAGMNEDPECTDLGTHFGHLDEIALALADRAATFYSDKGVLYFRIAPNPKRVRKNRAKKNEVCVVVRAGGNEMTAEKIAYGLRSRPVTVVRDGSDQVILRRREKWARL